MSPCVSPATIRRGCDHIVADAATALDKLIPLLGRKEDRSWQDTVEQNVSRWWETIERQATLSAKPTNSMRIAWELSQRLPSNAIVTADSGSSTRCDPEMPPIPPHATY